MVNDLLDNMTTINIDLETLGVKATDQVYTGAVYGRGKNFERKSLHSFDIDNSKHARKNLEDYVKTRHSSKFFGEKQKERGSLKNWAVDVSTGRASNLSDYTQSILNIHKEGGQGSILLAQNLQFENRKLSGEYLKGNIGKPFTELVDNIVNRETSDPSSFLTPKGISNLNWDRYNILMDSVRPAFLSGNKENLQKTLGSYFDKSMDIVSNYEEAFEKAASVKGIAVADLMDYSKALYAHGATQGKVNPAMLLYGNKVEFLSRTLLGEDEMHEALSDTIQQDKLFKIIRGEVLKIRDNKDYESPVLDKLSSSFKKEKVLERQLKSGAVSFVRQYLESDKTTDMSLSGIKKEALEDFYTRNRFLIQTGKVEGFDFKTFKTELEDVLDKTYKNQSGESIDREKLLYDLESELGSMSHQPKKSYTEYSKTISNSLGKLDKKKALALGGATAAIFTGSMFLGGEKEEQKKVEYNTYDEVYNSQYYGSEFADWQNRNNSHVMR